jgi:PAS domain-containing protein
MKVSESLQNDQSTATEKALRLAFDTTPAFIHTARPDGYFDYFNPLRLGIDVGAEWDSHIPFLHPDDHEETRRVWSTCLRTGCAGEVSFRVRNAQGGYRWFLSRAEPLRASDGTLLYWVGANLDIEERKRAEEELRRSKAYLSEAPPFNRFAGVGLDPFIIRNHCATKREMF